MTSAPHQSFRPSVPVAVIAAVARNGVIGRDGALPWHLPSDLKTFKSLTMGKPMIMGRKQYQSVGRPLPGRENIVVTRQRGFRAEGCVIVHDFDAALRHADHSARQSGATEIMVIGGAEIYRLALDRADVLYLTDVALDAVGNINFPAFDRSLWVETARRPIERGPRDDADATLVVLERRR